MYLPGRVWVAIHRTQNRWWDMRAGLKGFCNHCPWSPDHTRGGGYSFWRCALPRGHKSEHRARSYVWDDEGHTEYSPLEDSFHLCRDQPWKRQPTLSRRQWRELKKSDPNLALRHKGKLKYIRKERLRRIQRGLTWLFYDNLGILIASAVLIWAMYALAFCTVPRNG